MSDTPPDSNGHGPPEQPDEVQDYLDTLLTRATEAPEAQVSPAAEEPEAPQPPPRVAEQPRSRALTMIGGTAVRSLDTHSSPEVVERRRQPQRPPPSRPYAEPIRPLSLKLPLAEVKARPAPEPVEPPPAPAPAAPSHETAAPPAPAPAPAQSPPQPSAPVAEPPPAATDSETAAPATGAWLDNGRPDWAQERFQCLLFTVGGLTLAVPLVELGTIYPLTGELTPLFGQVDWFMGMMPVRDDHNVKTVDTARVVMPERYRSSMVDDYRYVITLDGVDWGLAVDQVSTAKSLHPDDVRWRGERSKRPWLAGTVVEHMCALLDVSQLTTLFESRIRTR